LGYHRREAIQGGLLHLQTRQGLLHGIKLLIESGFLSAEQVIQMDNAIFEHISLVRHGIHAIFQGAVSIDPLDHPGDRIAEGLSQHRHTGLAYGRQAFLGRQGRFWPKYRLTSGSYGR